MTNRLLMDMLAQIDERYIIEAAPAGMVDACEPRGTGRKSIKYALVVAAVIATLAGAVSVATYERWHMPDHGESYEGDTLKEHSIKEYPLPDGNDNKNPDGNEPDGESSGEVAGDGGAADKDGTVADKDGDGADGDGADGGGDTEPADPEPEPQIPDEWFIEQTVAILRIISKFDTDAEKMTVRRYKNNVDDREEVSVKLATEEQTRTVTFEAESGMLLAASTFGHEYTDNTLMSAEDALRCATEYYNLLPYPQGYEYTHLSKFDDHGWTYSFSKAATVETDGKTQTVYSDYEQVRITIDPCTGGFEMSNMFYYPLLDDHAPNQKPLTAQQALDKALESKLVSGLTQENSTFELCICLPDPGKMSVYNGTYDGDDRKFKNYDITRLAWKIECKFNYGVAFGHIVVYVDLYTGEVLKLM